MKTHTKIELAEYIRTETARKNIKSGALSVRSGVIPSTLSRAKGGDASFKLLHTIIYEIDNWKDEYNKLQPNRKNNKYTK